MRLRDSAIIELLYHEAKRNVLCGRYPRDISESYLLGGISARIALGNFNPQQHNSTFFRYVRLLFIDQHSRKNYFYRLRKETEKSWTKLFVSLRNRLGEYLPSYACVRSNPWSLFWPLSRLQRPDKSDPESLIVEQLKKIPNNIPSQRLMLNYLKMCWNKPYYGYLIWKFIILICYILLLLLRFYYLSNL